GAGRDRADRGFAAVLASPNLPGLRVLKVGRNQITDAGVNAVRAGMPAPFARLHLLYVSENWLTRPGIGRLEAARGDRAVTIEWGGNVQASAGGEGPAPAGG